MKNGDYILVLAPEGYPGKRYREKYCYEHHLVYWQNHGIIIKKDELIHHINENKHDNSPENLELKTKSSHNYHHNTSRGIRYILLKCPNCKQEFERPLRQTHIQKTGARYTTCSRSCSGKFSHTIDKSIGIEENVISFFHKYPTS